MVVSTSASPVVLNDVRVLSEKYQTNLMVSGRLPRLASTVFQLARGVVWADVVVAWFAELPAILCGLPARLLGRKIVVIVGGFETFAGKYSRYGGLRGHSRRMLTKAALRLANKIVTVSSSQLAEVSVILPLLRPMVIPNGVDCELFRLGTGAKVSNSVVTVVHTGSDLHVKGVDRLFKVARMLPGVTFTLVGLLREELHALPERLPTNVLVVPPVNHTTLRDIYQRSWVVCQLSRRESFGLALAEGMACGCIPVATEQGAMPELAAPIGRIVDGDDAAENARAISEALRIGSAEEARRVVVEHFSLCARRERLFALLDQIS